MKMKRFISLIALLLVLCTLFTACGGAAEPTEPTEPAEEVNIFKNSMQKSDPSQDEEFNVLLIGNSGCYYYVEELHGIAKADGIFMRVCNLYYSGATVMQHHTWWKNGDAQCEFFVTDDNGRVKTEGVDILYSSPAQLGRHRHVRRRPGQDPRFYPGAALDRSRPLHDGAVRPVPEGIPHDQALLAGLLSL